MALLQREYKPPPDNPIPPGALRLEVTWKESIPGDNSSLVTAGTHITTGRSYEGYRPETGEILLIKGLAGEAFEDIETLTIEVQPPLIQPDEIPEFTLLKIIY